MGRSKKKGRGKKRSDLERQGGGKAPASSRAQEPAEGPAEITEVRYSQWIGPLPSPEALERFNHVIPGGAERILRMTEGQAKHRRKLENRWSLTESFLRVGGLLFAGLIALSGISAGVFLIFYDKPLGAVAPFLFAVASLIAALRGDKVSRARREEQLKLNLES